MVGRELIVLTEFHILTSPIMRPTWLVAALALPLLAAAQVRSSPSLPLPRPQSQQQHSSQNISQTVITSTSLSTFVGLGPDRQVSTGTSTFVFTSTQTLTPAPQSSSNGTVGNGTVSGNNTVSANTTSTPRNLPTAPTDVNGGGAVAPSPGQSSTGGIFGPDDNYIAAASALKRNTFVVGFVGLALSGAMLVL